MHNERNFSFIRLALGFIFVWAFFDKLLGLGFSTLSTKSVLFAGASPTVGFLSSTTGFFAPFFHLLAGNAIVDVLFMLGLLCIGASLLAGIGLRIAGFSGALLMFLMWLAVLPPKTNPLIDDHVIYLFLFLVLSSTPEVFAQDRGLRRIWLQSALVQKYPILS